MREVLLKNVEQRLKVMKKVISKEEYFFFFRSIEPKYNVGARQQE